MKSLELTDTLPIHWQKNILQGSIYKIKANSISKKIVMHVIQNIETEFEMNFADILFLPESKQEYIFKKVCSIRRSLIQNFNKIFFRDLKTLLSKLKFSQQCKLDFVRLRAIAPNAHLNKKAEPAFYLHRDTWYANPTNQINFWIPLSDYSEKQTMLFYDDYYQREVKNNSNNFNFDKFYKKIGWQSQEANDYVYPQCLEESLMNPTQFQCQAGDIIIFSAQHLHGPIKNVTNKIRFSIDFRTTSELFNTTNSINDNLSQGDASLYYHDCFL